MLFVRSASTPAAFLTTLGLQIPDKLLTIADEVIE